MANDSDLLKGKHFCIRPFTQLSTFNDGRFRLCCSALEDERISRTSFTDLKDLWNSNQLISIREKLLNDDPIPECKNCYSQEGRGGISDRIQANQELSDYEVESLNRGIKNENLAEPPVVLDIRVGNLCNLRCQSCYPSLSNLVSKDVKEIFNNDRKGVVSVDNGHRLGSGVSIEELKPLLSTAQKLKVIGGEPMLNSFTHEVLDQMMTGDISQNIEFHIHTNLMKWDQNFCEKLERFAKTRLCMSVDAFGDLNSYIRYPSQWNHISKNLEAYLSFFNTKRNVNLAISPVIQIFNLFHIHQLIDYILELEAKYSTSVSLDFIYLTDPSYYSPYILPLAIKEEAREEFDRYYNQLNSDIQQRLSGLKEFYGSLSRQDENVAELKKFKEVTNIYDSHRELRVLDFVPWLGTI